MSNAIEIKNLKYQWRSTKSRSSRRQSSNKLVLDIDSLEVKEGESVFIKGPSGSGKSTLLNLLGGVLESQTEFINVLGCNLAKMSSSARDALRGEHMGFIFQQFNLIPYLSVLENITLPIQFSSARNKRLSDRKTTSYEEAIRLLSHLKLNVNDITHKPVTELSVGQQQRVAVARALMARPKLIIADEPTSSLDEDARSSFIKILFSECKSANSTLVFVSHDGQLGSYFDRVIDLEKINKAYIREEF